MSTFSVTEWKMVKKLNARYEDIQVKQHSKVKCLEYMLYGTMSGEIMTLTVINQINNKLQFLYQKNRILTPMRKPLLCNTHLISTTLVQLGIPT